MNAAEYFEKYRKKIASRIEKKSIKGITDLVCDLFMEIDISWKSGYVQDGEDLAEIIEETNMKWNAIARLFETEYGDPILAKNGFNKFIISKIPEFAEVLHT